MRLKLAVVGVVFVLVQGCATVRPQRPAAPARPPTVDRFATPSPEARALIDSLCLDGMPVDEHEPVGTTELIVRRGYVLEESSVDKVPLWVCESVSADQLRGHEVRSNRFMADPDLKGPKSYPNDYLRSGFDRGHQAPAGNQTVDAELKAQTFYMSNMAPQRPSLNRGIWRQLEDRSRTWVLRYGHAYEWTGPVRCTPDRQPVDTVTAGCQRQTIGEHQVAVPLFFYKIIVVRDQGSWKAIAFLMPNTDFMRPWHLESYITSIAAIEKATGLQFMPQMNAAERRALVAAISPMWP